MITPQAVKPGSKVFVVAPSGPFERTQFDAGLAWLEGRYEVVLQNDLYDREGFLAGSDDRRSSELLRALADPECRAIVTARGGYGATRLTAKLGALRLGGSPPWLVGFSDFTAVHLLATSSGLASLHAANVTTLGARPALRDAWVQALETPEGDAEFLALRSPARGRAEGRLVGGNLTVLAATLSAHPELRFREPSVLLLEDVGEAPYRLERSLNTLWEAGALDPVVGCALGEFVDCRDATYGTTALDVVEQFLLRLRVPIVSGLPIGHGDSLSPLKLGHHAELDATRGTLRVVQAA